MRRALRGVLLAVTALAILIVQATPSIAVNPTPTVLRDFANVDEFSPVATALHLAWNQNSAGSPNHYDVYAQPRDNSTGPWKVNGPGTSGWTPSAIAGTETIIYQQSTSSVSDLYLYRFSTKIRSKLPSKVDSPAWEYNGVASASFIAFMRLTSTARQLLLYNRTSGKVTTIASIKKACGSCLYPDWVGATHMLYVQCSPKTFVCRSKLWSKGGTIQTIPNPGGARSTQYGPSMDEASGDVYYVHSTTFCGLFVEIRRTNISNLSAFVTIDDFDEGIDGGRTSLAPDAAIPSDTDLLFDEWDCLQSDSGIYEIDSVNTL
jgi:hypothetical protein